MHGACRLLLIPAHQALLTGTHLCETPQCRTNSLAAYRKEQMLSLLDDLDADVEATKPIHWTVKKPLVMIAR